MSAAETLRAAAALMRSRAEAASGSPWSRRDDDLHTEVSIIALTTWHDVTDDAEHIASWHPAVALAVAAWLEQSARLYTEGSTGPLDMPAALAVATAYLGSDQ